MRVTSIMPIFQYKGYRPDGSGAEGTIEADGLQSAVSGVKALGIFPRDIVEHIHKEKLWAFRRSDNRLLPHITRQLSTLLGSGVPLIDALRSLSEENSNGYWKAILVDIRDRISAGSSLSRALGHYRILFPEFYRNMVEAGEKSGSLDVALKRVADFLEKQASIREKVRTAMVYPAFMASVGFIVMSFLFTFVVPKIVRIFENTQSALPVITIILIAISNFFIHYWWALLILSAVISVLVKRTGKRHRLFLDRVKLKLPGGLLNALYYGRFARTLGFLLDGGLPMLGALELSAKSVGNVVLEKKIMLAATRVAEGAKLSASLDNLPPVLLQLIATGEKSGTLGELLGNAAVSYEEEFERKVQKALSLLEPAMILLMGLIVGFIVLAVLLPMFELNQLVR
jgi:general secretion pathway protein F